MPQSVAETTPTRNKPTRDTIYRIALERLRNIRDVDAIAVAVTLLDHLDYRQDSPRFLRCYPSRQAIAERLGIGVKRVTAALRTLCDPSAGLFAKTRRYHTSTVYVFIVNPDAFRAARDRSAKSKGQIEPFNTAPNERAESDPLTQRARPRVKGPNRTKSKGQIGPFNPCKNHMDRSRSQTPPTPPSGQEAGESASVPSDSVDELIGLYTEWQRTHCPPTAEPLGNVGAAFRAEIAAAGLDASELRAALERATRSDLLTGRVPGKMEGRGASLRWFLNPDNRTKLHAGVYDRRPARVIDHPRRPQRIAPERPDTRDTLHAQLCERLMLADDLDDARLGRWAVEHFLADGQTLETSDALRVVLPPDTEIAYVRERFGRLLANAGAQLRPGKRLEITTTAACEPVAVTA
nr:MAG: hypothetical protein DIU57_18560 [Pseudomonadota bacterium]